MKTLSLIIFLLSTYTCFSQKDYDISSLVNKEIFYWEEIYNDDYLLSKTLEKTNYVDYDSLTFLDMFFVNDTRFSLYAYECTLKKVYYEKSDTLRFITIKYADNFYRLAGFSFSDLLLLQGDSGINAISILSVLRKRNPAYKDMFHTVAKAIKKNNYYYQSGVEILTKVKSLGGFSDVLIVPLNKIEVIVAD